MSQRSVPSASGSAAQESLRERRDFARSFDSLEPIFAMVRRMLDARGVGEADAYAIEMTIEELFTNMVKYNADGLGRIGLEIECTGNDVTCSLIDPDSDRFDVNAMPDANVAPAGRAAPARRPRHPSDPAHGRFDRLRLHRPPQPDHISQDAEPGVGGARRGDRRRLR